MQFQEGFDPYVCAGDTIETEHGGFRFVATVHRDESSGEPWKEVDGHGEVSEWTTRAKRPGELVLSKDRDCKRFYDFASAVQQAKDEGWGGEGATLGERAATAARRDYEALRSWCNDEWWWCGVVIQAYRDTFLVHDNAASLWGIEANYPDSDNSYLLEVANEILPEALEETERMAEYLLAILEG